MKTEQAQPKKGLKTRLLGAVMGLALVAGALLSMGSAATEHATSFVEVGRPQAAELTPTTPDSVSPGEAIAESDSLDLQLD